MGMAKELKTIGLLKNVALLGGVLSCFAFTLSGSMLLVGELTRDVSDALDAVDITNEFESKDINVSTKMLPGDSHSFSLTVTSRIQEKVNYTISFINHRMSSVDEYFYVSMSAGNEKLLNNTLDQIFAPSLTLEQRQLDSFESEKFDFTFSINSIVDFEYIVDFSIHFEAKGKLTY